MGNNANKIVQVDNIEYHLSHCETIKSINSNIYGTLHLVRYNNMEFYLGESKTGECPQTHSLHYLVPPEILVVPEFTLLQNTNPQSIDELIQIIEGVAELCQKTIVGVSHNRVAHAGKWGIIGQYPQNWHCQTVIQDPFAQGIYLSPQQMMALSQGLDPINCDLSKSDMFALGIMLIQIIFRESMSQIYDYENYEIKLKPLLIKLNTLKHEFGEQLYGVFLKMLELDQKQRIDFDELIDMLHEIKNPRKIESSAYMSNSNSSYSSYRAPVANKSPLRKRQVQVYRNDVSPLRGGKFLQRDRTGRTPQRNTRSPMKRDLRINSRFQKQNSTTSQGGNFTTRSPYKPTLIRKSGVSPLSRR